MSCSARQDLVARALLAIVAKTGPFTRDAGCEGAGYVGAAANSGAPVGFRCENCVLFRPPKGCIIVRGVIERAGVCRFHIVPQERLVRTGGPDRSGAPGNRLEGSIPDGAIGSLLRRK